MHNMPVENKHGACMTIHESAILSIRSLSYELSFQAKHRKGRSFSRTRVLTFPVVVGMILRMVKTSIQITCNWLGNSMEIEPVSKQAFSQARHRLSYTAFEEMHADGIRVNYSMAPKAGLWKEYRVIGCDGSTLRLPESKELAKEFGRWNTREGITESAPIARISEYTDMTTKLVLSGRISPCKVSEEELAREQLNEVVSTMRKYGQKKMLFVYDRGYPSDEFIQQHLDLGVDFLFRLPRNFNRSVKKIYESQEAESFIFSEGSPMLRVSQFDLPSGERELLLTSLTDYHGFSQEDLSCVYHGRWSSMEEGYKRQKVTMQMENFSGKTVEAVRQEYWATLTMGNLIEMGCIEIEGHWIPGNLPKKQVNRSVVFGSTRDVTMQVILRERSAEGCTEYFQKIAKRSMITVRPNRKFSRAKVGKPKKHHIYRRSC
jgi:hypothetical protein